MGDLFQTGAAWLTQQRVQHAAQLVTYTRGAHTVALLASKGSTAWEQDDQAAGIVRYESVDWLITTVDLVLNGQHVMPLTGDRITAGGRIYEVMSPGGELPYRFSDRAGYTLRVFTKHVGEAS